MVLYRQARQDDLQELAQVHRVCFPRYFLSALGEDLLQKYYSEFLERGEPFVVACVKDRLIGFCMGYYGNGGDEARQAFEQKNRKALVRRLLLLCLRGNTGAWKRCWRKVFHHKHNSAAATPRPADADLLSICVLEAFRGGHTAQQLLQAFEAQVMEHAPGTVRKCMLSVYQGNVQAQRFYEKNGFVQHSRTAKEIRYIKRYTDKAGGAL